MLLNFNVLLSGLGRYRVDWEYRWDLRGKRQKMNKREKKLKFGPFWSVLNMRNKYKRVFKNLSVIINFTHVEPKLKPGINFFFFLGCVWNFKNHIWLGRTMSEWTEERGQKSNEYRASSINNTIQVKIDEFWNLFFFCCFFEFFQAFLKTFEDEVVIVNNLGNQVVFLISSLFVEHTSHSTWTLQCFTKIVFLWKNFFPLTHHDTILLIIPIPSIYNYIITP